MNLPEPLSQAAKWTLVVGLAFFAADATAAVIQDRLQVPLKALPDNVIGVVKESIPAQAPPPGLISLLKTTEPESSNSASDEGGGSTGGSNGKPGRSVKPLPVQPPTNLQLQGTMAGAGGTGLAMINFNGQTQVVSVGEGISNFTLVSVSPYNVRLESEGQSITLDMNSSGTKKSVPQKPVARKLPSRPRPGATPSPTPSPEGEENEILTQRELRNILDNPAQFAGKGFRMKPVLKDGTIIGMRVSLRDQGHPLARLGIKNGDVVKSLNGTPINGPEALSGIYRTLRNTSSLSFDVDRNGISQKVDIALEE